MIILKTQDFGEGFFLVEFINKNNIKQENILSIVAADSSSVGTIKYSLFFYGDSAVKELTHGLFGWS